MNDQQAADAGKHEEGGGEERLVVYAIVLGAISFVGMMILILVMLNRCSTNKYEEKPQMKLHDQLGIKYGEDGMLEKKAPHKPLKPESTKDTVVTTIQTETLETQANL